MIDALHEPFFQRAVLATLFAGIACSVVGALVVTMRLSFLGVCMSHAAFAGALLGLVLGLHPMSMALALSLIAASSLGPLADRGRLAPDAATGIVFSSFLGVSFLLLALVPGPKSEALGLLWGSVLTATTANVYVLAVVACATVLAAWLFFKEIQTVVFSRELATSLGIPATAVFYGILVASGLTAAASLQSIGGLLVFSLMVNPAAAAYQLTYSLRKMFALSVFFGVASGWIGLALSWTLNLPTGALIALVSCGFFGVACLLSPKRRGKVLHGRERS